MTLIKGSLPKFIERRTYDTLMFGYVTAVHDNFPTVTLRSALEKFAERFELGPDEFNLESARQAYERMRKELREHERTNL